MIIFKPPHPVVGAPNLNKGLKVYNKVLAPHDLTVDVTHCDLESIIAALKTVHDTAHVDAVLAGKKMNGYSDCDKASNTHSVISCHILADAAKIAVERQVAVFAPVSGFHHAGYRFSEGYCTFNGLILAALEARKLKADAQVLIIDGDGHWGNGTQDIIDKGVGWIKNCSLSRQSVRGQAQVAMDKFNEQLDKEWDLVIYQAGADSHIADPYSSGYLLDNEWVARDRAIFERCKDRFPLVFNLAGGYNGEKTLELHASTVVTYREVYEAK